MRPAAGRCRYRRYSGCLCEYGPSMHFPACCATLCRGIIQLKWPDADEQELMTSSRADARVFKNTPTSHRAIYAHQAGRHGSASRWFMTAMPACFVAWNWKLSGARRVRYRRSADAHDVMTVFNTPRQKFQAITPAKAPLSLSRRVIYGRRCDFSMLSLRHWPSSDMPRRRWRAIVLHFHGGRVMGAETVSDIARIRL